MSKLTMKHFWIRGLLLWFHQIYMIDIFIALPTFVHIMLSLQVTLNILSLLICVKHPPPHPPTLPSTMHYIPIVMVNNCTQPCEKRDVQNKVIVLSLPYTKSQQQFKYYLWLLSSLNDM